MDYCDLQTASGPCGRKRHTQKHGPTTFCARHDSMFNEWKTDRRALDTDTQGATADFRKFMRRTLAG